MRGDEPVDSKIVRAVRRRFQKKQRVLVITDKESESEVRPQLSLTFDSSSAITSERTKFATEVVNTSVFRRDP